MKLEPPTKAKLEHGKTTLAEEFTTVPRTVISTSVDATAGHLLRSARFDDYIPLLARRYVRDRLLERRGA
jgi:hypothetical protein